MYASSGALQIYITTNNNCVGNKIVKAKPFGFIRIFDQKFIFYCVHQAWHTSPWGCEWKPYNHTLEDGATLGVVKEVLIWAHTVINMNLRVICEIIGGVHFL
jgi:hypothetical protein